MEQLLGTLLTTTKVYSVIKNSCYFLFIIGVTCGETEAWRH